MVTLGADLSIILHIFSLACLLYEATGHILSIFTIVQSGLFVVELNGIIL